MKSFLLLFIIIITFFSCKKASSTNAMQNDVVKKPVANFSYTIDNDGQVPCNVTFNNASQDAMSYKWVFSIGSDTSKEVNPKRLYNSPKNYTVKLVVTNKNGKDSVSKLIAIKPIMKSVVVYLVTPKGEKYNPNYYTALKNATTNIQSWYKTQMRNTKTFMLNPLLVDTLTGLHNYEWYNSYNGTFSGSDSRFYGYQNTYE